MVLTINAHYIFCLDGFFFQHTSWLESFGDFLDLQAYDLDQFYF